MKKDLKLSATQIKLLKYSSYGIYPIVPVFLGLTLGLLLDSILNTRPILVLVFLFLGMVGSFYNLFRLIKELKKSNDRSST